MRPFTPELDWVARHEPRNRPLHATAECGSDFGIEITRGRPKAAARMTRTDAPRPRDGGMRGPGEHWLLDAPVERPRSAAAALRPPTGGSACPRSQGLS